MATFVSQILTQIKAIIAAELGNTYTELPRIYDLSKSDLRRARLGYGVRPLDATPAETVVRAYTLDHGFEIILTDTIARDDSDAQRETVLNTMYDKADEIFKDLVNQKINLATFVMNVSQPSLSEPEFIDENKLVILRMQFIVKYRSALNL